MLSQLEQSKSVMSLESHLERLESMRKPESRAFLAELKRRLLNFYSTTGDIVRAHERERPRVAGTVKDRILYLSIMDMIDHSDDAEEFADQIRTFYTMEVDEHDDERRQAIKSLVETEFESVYRTLKPRQV